MKKKLAALFLAVILLLAVPVHADEARPRVIDEAGLFTYEEAQALQARADSLAQTYQIDVVILTIDSLDGKSREAYADDYFDYNGYGIGEDNSGVLFLLAMETREWHMSTCGDAIYALTDYGIECVFSEISGYLADGDYYDAFSRYLDVLPTYFEAFQNGKPIDGFSGGYTGPGDYSPGTREDVVHYERPRNAGGYFKIITISLAIGAAVAALVLFGLRSQMNTAKPQADSSQYLKGGSFHLNTQRDIFLYSHVTRTRRSESSGGGGGGSHGGGSSVHHSSSGSSHGGGGGHF